MSLRSRRRILSTTTQLPALAASPAIDPRLLTGATLRDDMQGQERAINDAEYAAQRQSLDMERQQVAADREAAKQATAAAKQANTASTFAQELQYDAQGIQHRRNPVTKTVEPVPDPMTGRPITKNLEGPVEYDPMGRAVQTVRKDGVMSRQDLDAAAPVGRNPKDKADPNIYVQNKNRPWDAYAPTDALVHADPRIRTAAAQTMMTEDANALSSEEARIHAEMADPELKGITQAKREKAQERVAQGLAMEGDDKILEKAKIIDAKQRRLSEIGIAQASRGNMTAEEYAAKKLASLPADTVNISRQKLLTAQRTGIQALRAKLDEEDAAYAADYEAFLPQTQGFRPDQAPEIRQKMGQMALRKQMIDAKRKSLDEDVKKHEEFTATLNTQAVTAQNEARQKATVGVPQTDKPAPTAPVVSRTWDELAAAAKDDKTPWKTVMEQERGVLDMLKADPAMPETAKAKDRWQRVMESMDPQTSEEDAYAVNAAAKQASVEVEAARQKDAAAAAQRKQAGAEAFRLVTSQDSQDALAENYTPDERKALEEQANEYRRATFQDTWDEKAKPTHYSKDYGELNVNPSLLFKPDEYTKAVDTAEAPPLAKEKAMQALPLMQQQAAPPIFEGFLSSSPTEQAFQNSIQKTIKDHGWPVSMRGTKDVMTKDWTPDQKALAVQEFMSRSDFSPNFNQIALGFSRGLDQLQQTAYGVGSFFGSDAAQKAGEAEIQQQDMQGAAAQAGGGSQILGSLTSGAVSLVPSLGAGILSGGAGLGVNAAMKATSIAAGAQSAGSAMIEATKAGMGGVAARLTALGSGAITAGLTQLGGTSGTEAIIGKLFGQAGEHATMNVVRPTLAKAIVEKVKGYGIDGLKEAFLEEMPDQFFQNVLQSATYKPDQDLGEGLVETGIVSFLLGGGVNAATDVLGGAKEKLNITKEIERARIRRELGQQIAAQNSPEIITATLAGSPMEAQTPDVLAKIADFDARIVDGQDQLAKATSKAQTLYSNRQLAQAYGQRKEYVNEVRSQLRDSFVTAANEEIDAAVPPSEDPAAAQTFEADKTRAKALVAIASGKTADLDNATLALVDLTRDEKGNLAPAKGKTDSPDGTPRVIMQDGQPVISQGAIDRMTGLFPATEPLIGKTENERRAEIIASTTAASAAKETADAVPAEKTAEPAPVSGATTSAPAETPASSTEKVVEPGRTAAPQTFDVEVEGMADPVEITAATEAEARAAAIAQHPGKMIRSVVAVESETPTSTPGLTPSNPASAATDSELPPSSAPSPASTTPAGGLTPASINKAIVAASGKRPSKETAKRYQAVSKALHRETTRWQAAFPGGITVATKTGGGGVQVDSGTATPSLRLDFKALSESIDALEGNSLAWVERAIQEEVIHAVAVQMESRGELDMQDLFDSLPEETKAQVRAAYPASNQSLNLGHEFFRMAVQQRLAGRKPRKGQPILTEQTMPPAVLAKLADALNKLLAYFRDLAKSLKRQKASPETIARVVAAADMIEAGVRSLVSQETPKTGDKPAVEELPSSTWVQDSKGYMGTILRYENGVPVLSMEDGEEMTATMPVTVVADPTVTSEAAAPELNTPADLKGEKIDKEWTAFADSTRSLGIPREDMPQIKTEHRGALANFLRAGGIEFTRETALPGSLHPTQAEYSPAKVKKAREWVGESNRAILVSSDDHVLDGHHQWMAALAENPTEPMDVILLDAPIRELLAAVAQFPSAGMDAVPEAQAPAPAAGKPLSKAKQDLKSFMDDLEGGAVQTQPVAPNYAAGFPREKRATVDTLVGALLDEGVNSAESLAQALTEMGLPYRKYSRALYAAMTSIEPALPDVALSDWNAIYSALDKPAATEEAPAPAPVSEPVAASPQKQAADALFARMVAIPAPLSWRELFAITDKAWGGTQAEGAYTVKDAYDALELAVNRQILQGKAYTNATQFSADEAVKTITDIENNILARLPTQTKRTAESDALQQFSTPPQFAYLANWAAGVRPGDVMWETSAGIGGLAVFSKAAGATVLVNEFSARRREFLKELPFDHMFGENAEMMNAIMEPRIQRGDVPRPTVVVINPPFSNGAESGKKKDTTIGAKHLEEAMKLLEPGGRMVAIMGEGMSITSPTFRGWFQRMGRIYNVRANIHVDGSNYAKYGTSFSNRIIIIDKTGPTPDLSAVVGGSVDKITELPQLLEGIHNDRTTPTSAQQSGSTATEGQTAVSGTVPSPDPVTGGRRPDGRPGRRGGVGTTRADGPKPDNGNGTPGSAATGDNRGTEGLPGGPDGSPDRNADAGDVGGLTINSERRNAATDDEDGSVFSSYRPSKVSIPGSKPHPANLVESAAMASVEAPDPVYTPNLPAKISSEGLLSEIQLENVVYAGQAHAQTLPDGERKGYFIGDGTGVGKGRQIYGIILDNMRQGRKKAVWVSKSAGLLTDARRDAEGLEGDPTSIFSLPKAGADIARGEGILFTTYDTLRGKHVEGGIRDHGKWVEQTFALETPASRLEQLVRWLGKDFDGVIAFDEAHKAGNAVPTKGTRGFKKASLNGITVVDLQKVLPNARIVYVSATGATEVTNLSFADRLGLWGTGTPFPTKQAFFDKISAGGISAMEIVARDMKALGVYLARSISFKGVGFSRVTQDLTPEQTETYNGLARGWQLVLRNMNDAMVMTGGNKSASQATAVKSQFWGAQQRFFNSLLTAMEIPALVRSMDERLAAGDSAVLQLVNTNEAQQKRAIAKALTEAGDGESNLDDLDLSPKDILLNLINNSFPTYVHHQVPDPANPEKQVWVRLLDAEGNPVADPAAVALKEETLMQVQMLPTPDGALDQILDHYGSENVAEVTGRGQRLVRKKNEAGVVVRQIERRNDSRRKVEAQEFQDGKRKILVFSDAGGTGYSYHADLKAKNQTKRAHYLVQAGWRADGALQGFGRTHRSNQAQPPFYYLVDTNIKGHRRFLSTIARRLAQLGALTAGERKATGQGMFSESDNLEGQYADDALMRLISDIHVNEVQGWDLNSFAEKMGFGKQDVDRNTGEPIFKNDLIDPETGGLNRGNVPGIPQFLNRLLALELDDQNFIFDQFDNRLAARVQRAQDDGTFDPGTQQYKAKSMRIVDDQTVYEHPGTTAKTRIVDTEVTNDVSFTTFEEMESMYSGDTGVERFLKNKKSGRVFAIRQGRELTSKETGAVVQGFRRIGTRGNIEMLPESELTTGEEGRYDVIPASAAKAEWDAEIAAADPVTKKKESFIVGALLPIWDRIGQAYPKIFRFTDAASGQSLLGVLIPQKDLAATRNRLGAGKSVTPEQAYSAVIEDGSALTLANGWSVSRVRLSGDYRLEVRGLAYNDLDQFKNVMNGIVERVAYNTRFFLPTGDMGIPSMEKLLQRSPVVKIGGEDVGAGDGTALQTQSPAALARSVDAPDGFYSAAVKLLDQKMPARASKEQVKAILASAKPDEVKWSGVMPWIDAQPDTITKEAVTGFMRGEGRVKFEEFSSAEGQPVFTNWFGTKEALMEWASNDDTLVNQDGSLKSGLRAAKTDRGWNLMDNGKGSGVQAKYSQYQLPGGTNYREVVLAMPDARKTPDEAAMARFGKKRKDLTDSEMAALQNEYPPSYTSSHFADVPNYVAHMRLNDRVDGYGAPGLLIEELQSDRHQQGRKDGYREEFTAADSARMKEISEKYNGKATIPDQVQDEWNELAKKRNSTNPTDAPFRTTWPLQMFKRALRDAVDAGKQWIGWTSGSDQVKRFSLSNRVESVNWFPNPDGTKHIELPLKGEDRLISMNVDENGIVQKGSLMGREDPYIGKPLDEVVGKDLAAKIIGEKRGFLKGVELDIGGEGMRSFYDGILPKEISKYVNQWGGKVERTAMEKPSPIDGRSLAELEAAGEIDNAITGLSKDKINAVAIWRVNITPEMAATVATVGQPLYAQSPKRLLRELGVNSDEIAARAARASQEESGARTVIDPTRAMGAGVNTEGAGNDTILATSDLYAQEVTAETVAQWDEAARAMLAADYEGAFRAITAAARKGGILSPELTRAAQMLTEAESRRPMTKAQIQRMQLLVWSNRLAGTEAARSLRARVDPFKTPAQRHREAIAKSIFMPPPETRAALDAAETPEERTRLVLKDSKRIAAIQAALAKMGLTIDDILAGDRMLVARRHDMFRQFVGSNLSAAELAASTELIDGAVTFEAAAAKHGISSEKLKQSFQQSVDSIGAELDRRREMAKAAMGKPSPLNTAPVGADPWVAFDFQGGAMMTDEEWAASKKAIMESMGLFPANQQGKRRTATRRPAPRTPGEAKDTIKIDRGRSVEVSILKGADLSDVTDVYRIMRIHSAAASNGFDMLREYWINNLLSGPVTQFKNATSNLLFGTWNLVASRGMESLVNIVARNDKSASMGEFTAIMKSLAPAWGRGVRLAKLAWETESDHFSHMVLDEHLSLMDTGPAGEYRQTAIPGTVGRVVRMPGRALMFADGFFKGLFGTMEAAAHAHRIAKAEGLTPGSAQFQTRMDALVAEPGSEAWIAAVRQAETNTFQNQLDPTKNPVDAVPKLIISASHSKHLMVRLIATLLFPFTKTPYNVYREGLRRSPLGAVLLAGQAAKAGWVKLQGGQLRTDVPPALIKAFAEQVFAWTGTLLLLSAIEGDDDDYDKKFLITGSAPKDRSGRDMQERTSGGAYVIKWGKTVIPYGGIEPIATVLGTVADMVRTSKTDGTLAEKTNAIFHAVKRGAIDKTFLQGLKGISDLLANDETSGGPSMPEKARRAILQAIVPNIIRQPLRNSDSIVPDSAGAPWWWEAAPIPGEAEARVNPGSGEDKKRTGTSVSRILIPSAIEPEENVSHIDKALMKWNRAHPDQAWAPDSAPKSIEMGKQRIDLSPGALNYLNKRSGTLARKMLANTKLTGDEHSFKIIKKAYEDARSRARDELKRRPLDQIGTVRK